MGSQEREVSPLKWGAWKFQTTRATLYHTLETFNCFFYLIFYFLPLILTVKGWIIDCDQSPVSSFFQAVLPHQTCQQSGSPDWPTEMIRPLWINVLPPPLGECGTLRALIWWSQQLLGPSPALRKQIFTDVSEVTSIITKITVDIKDIKAFHVRLTLNCQPCHCFDIFLWNFDRRLHNRGGSCTPVQLQLP